MKSPIFGLVCYLAIFVILVLLSDGALAQVGGIGGNELASRMKGLTTQIINVILPAASILGLVYAAIQATTGDQGAKQRMVLILFASIVGFIAPLIIGWLQKISG